MNKSLKKKLQQYEYEDSDSDAEKKIRKEDELQVQKKKVDELNTELAEIKDKYNNSD